MTQVLKGKPVADALYQQLEKATKHLLRQKNHAPTLCTILVGEDSASKLYVSKKGQMCAQLGFGHKDFNLPATTPEAQLLELIEKLNQDKAVDGILVQKPLPKHFNESKVLDAISPAKDVDCFSPVNVGMLFQGRASLLPCTPAGVMEMLRFYGHSVSGKNALVIGRSDIVGKPMAMLLLQANATVSVAHSKTRDLAAMVRDADIIVSAIGRPHFLTKDLPWKKTAVVVDVGTNRLPTGKVVGDVSFDEVSPLVSAISPVPGGVGPMTIALLMQNTAKAAFERLGERWSFSE